MDFKTFLLKVFPEKDDEKHTKMIDNLKDLGFDSVTDLNYFDEDAAKDLKSFTRIEIKKLINNYLKFNNAEEIMDEKHSDPETFDHVVNNVFSGTPAKRLEEIKKILNKEQIYNGVDVHIIDTNKLRDKRLPLSEVEILKIEEYIRKKNPVRYEEIRAAKLRKDELTLMELKKKKEIELFSRKEEEELKYLGLKLKQNMELKALEMKANAEQQHLEYKKMEEKSKQENIRLQRKEDAKIKLAKIESERIANKYYIQSKIDEKKELQMQVLRFEQECIKINKTIAGIEAGWSYIGMAADLGTAKIDLKKTTELLEVKKGKLDEVERQLQKFDRS